MNYVGKLLSNFKGFYNEINSATLTGAIDIVIVKQEDGSYATSPWHVRFGKLGVMRSREKVVDIEINGAPADIQMKLGEAGEAFFVEEAEHEDDDSEIPDYLATSPLPDSLELMEQGIKMLHDGETLPETIIPVEGLIGSNEDIHLTDMAATDEAATGLAATDTSHINASATTEEDITPTGDTKSVTDSITPSPSLTKELSIVVESEDGTDSVLFDSSSYFRPVTTTMDLHSSNRVEIGIQTDMTGEEVESKASRTRLSSGNSCTSIVTSTSSVDLKTTSAATSPTTTMTVTDSSKIPSFIRLDSETEITQKAKERKRRRKRKATTMNVHERRRQQSHLEVGSSTTESGSSIEEGLFELELSGDDEIDNAGLCSVGRTISMPMIEHRLTRTDEWANSQYAASFHPFSDGDITPIISPVSTRPPSPKSDTEYECPSTNSRHFDSSSQTHLTGDDMATVDSVRWRWGELPENDTSIKAISTVTVEHREEEKTSGGLFQFMRKTKKMRHQPEQEGIYLDDLNLNELDPEVAALYLYQGKSYSGLRAVREEDNESGRGASLPQSPVTVEGGTHTTSNICYSMSDISLSLCGGLKESEGLISHERFLQSLITYDEFCENPNIMNSPNLVIKMADKYYNWQIAGPIIMSVLAFQRPLPERAVEDLVKQHMPKKEAQKRRGWFLWGRSGSEPTYKKEAAVSPSSSNPPTAPSSPEKANKNEDKQQKEDVPAGLDLENADHTKPLSVEIPVSHTESVSVATQMSPPLESPPASGKKFHKSLKLSSEKIATLNLRDGVNEVSFSVTTQFQGTTRCEAYIYLWNWDDHIIISDIDGTITKSDVLGQVLPMIGKDWSQAGIANLYNQIRQNGYRFVYLSARAIGQSKITRDYLKSIRQGELGLPDGPLLLSPSSLISAFHKEVIERRPQDFKISCLRDIKALFPSTHNPFYSGFGNKINDVWAYQAVNIPITRIFTVNHRGELRHELTCTFQSSYTKMSDTVDHLFPPLLDVKEEKGKIHSGNFPVPDEFSNFTYWREPLPDIDEDLDKLIGGKK